MRSKPVLPLSRRHLLSLGAGAAGGLVAGLACSAGDESHSPNPGVSGPLGSGGGNAEPLGSGGENAEQPGSGGAAGKPTRDPQAVSIVRCENYDYATVHAALKDALDQIGDLNSLVQGKTVGLKPNLTGDFQDVLGLSAGETYITHNATVLSLTSLLFEAGARRVVILESIPTTDSFAEVVGRAGWDLSALLTLGDVRLENTRNLGSGAQYSRLYVPQSAQLYNYFDVNSGYEDIDVFVSLAKMKNHALAGVTLSMKNLFGITPLSLYGSETGLGESALGFRGPSMHDGGLLAPGEIEGYQAKSASYRISRIVADQLAARPIDLSIIDGITSMSGGEGPWQTNLTAVAPGLLIAGWNAVVTDATATRVMGYDPLGTTGPFSGENHILLAHQAGLGNADASQSDLRGLSVAEALYRFG